MNRFLWILIVTVFTIVGCGNLSGTVRLRKPGSGIGALEKEGGIEQISSTAVQGHVGLSGYHVDAVAGGSKGGLYYRTPSGYRFYQSVQGERAAHFDP